MSRGASGEVAGRLVKEKVGVTAGIVTQEVGKPPNGICGTVGAVVVVPAGHLALILVAAHVWSDADHGLVNVAVTKTATPITGAVPNLVVGL